MRYSDFALISIMVLLIAALSLWMCSCSKSKTKSNEPITDKLTLYRGANLDLVTRCDSATFWTHAAALGVHPESVETLEKTPGRIERHVDPCYPDFSRSEASREMYIGWLHYIWTTKDTEALDRIIDYGTSHGWVFGEGPSDLVDMSPLTVIIYIMRDELNLTLTDSASLTFDETLSGFKGHVLASYLWLWGRVNGSMGPLGMSTLRALVDASPGDPMYQALLHRFTDGDFSVAIRILGDTNVFPEDRIPDTKASYGWGSCPDVLYYLIVDGIIRGI